MQTLSVLAKMPDGTCDAPGKGCKVVQNLAKCNARTRSGAHKSASTPLRLIPIA